MVLIAVAIVSCLIFTHLFTADITTHLGSLDLGAPVQTAFIGRLSWFIFTAGLLLMTVFFNPFIVENDIVLSLPISRSSILTGATIPFLLSCLMIVSFLSIQIVAGFCIRSGFDIWQTTIVSFSVFILIFQSLIWGLALNNLAYLITRRFLSGSLSGFTRVAFMTALVLASINFFFSHPLSWKALPPTLIGEIYKKTYLHLPSIWEQAAILSSLGLAACSHFFSSRLFATTICDSKTLPTKKGVSIFTTRKVVSWLFLEALGITRDRKSTGLIAGISALVVSSALLLFLTRPEPQIKIFFTLSSQFSLPFLLSSITFQTENRHSMSLIHRTWPLSIVKQEMSRALILSIGLSSFAVILLSLAGYFASTGLSAGESGVVILLILFFNAFASLVAKLIPGKDQDFFELAQIALFSILVSIPLFAVLMIPRLPITGQLVIITLFSSFALMFSLKKERRR